MFSTQLPATLYTAEQTRALDRTAIAGGVPGFKLMQRAGHAAFDRLRWYWPELRKLTILCGTGNNGGDGLVIAGLAVRAGLQVQLLCIGDNSYPDKLQGEAAEAWYWLQGEELEWQPYQQQSFSGDLIIDAMLGTGINGEVRGSYRDAIEQINRSGLPVQALDIPSGLCSDTGMPQGAAVKADMTVTFIGVKQGLLTGQGPEFSGLVMFDGLRVEDEVYESVPVAGFITGAEDCRQLLPPRVADAHKGSHGHVLIVGGDSGMGGATMMAAQAAGRVGAGLVTVATREEHVSALLSRYPEAMTIGVRSGADLLSLMERATVIVIGPGLGQHAWGEQLLMQALKTDKPIVLDADALNLMNNKGLFKGDGGENWIITPHPGEASQLLDDSVAAIQSDRFTSLANLQQLSGGVALLKGAGTLISDGDVVHLCPTGNPGMAVGGMGDVLSGVIGGLLAQGLSNIDAARLGAWLHGAAGDRSAAESGERGMQATDLLAQLRLLVNGL